MVDSHRTFDYEGRNTRYKVRHIASRRLGDLEFAKLEKLLPIYEEKLKAWWEEKNAGQVGEVLDKKITEEGDESRGMMKTADDP